MTVGDISATLRVGKSSVSTIINKHLDLGTLSPKTKSNCGRKCQTTPRTDKILLWNSKIHPEKISQDLLRLTTGVSIDSSRVRHRFTETSRVEG